MSSQMIINSVRACVPSVRALREADSDTTNVELELRLGTYEFNERGFQFVPGVTKTRFVQVLRLLKKGPWTSTRKCPTQFDMFWDQYPGIRGTVSEAGQDIKFMEKIKLVPAVDMQCLEREFSFRLSTVQEKPMPDFKLNVVHPPTSMVRVKKRLEFVYLETFVYHLTVVATGRTKDEASRKINGISDDEEDDDVDDDLGLDEDGKSPVTYEIEIEMLPNKYYLQDHPGDADVAASLLEKGIDMIGRKNGPYGLKVLTKPFHSRKRYCETKEKDNHKQKRKRVVLK
jgi:hypothetical protein